MSYNRLGKSTTLFFTGYTLISNKHQDPKWDCHYISTHFL